MLGQNFPLEIIEPPTPLLEKFAGTAAFWCRVTILEG